MESMRRKLMRSSDDFAQPPETPTKQAKIPLPRTNRTTAPTPSPSQKPSVQTQADATNSESGPSRPTPPRSSPSKMDAADATTSAPPPPRAPTPAVAQNTRPLPRITCRGWNVDDMCTKYKNFRPVPRVSALASLDELQGALDKYEQTGEPLIIEDWHKHPKWRSDILNMDWLLENVGGNEIKVRNMHDGKDSSMLLSEFVNQSRKQEVYNSPEETQRLYWKDADTPQHWRDWLPELIPQRILPGCPDDLFRHLDKSEEVESLLCYFGIGDTYTAAHKDLCASSGHNLMAFSENGGSSFWFMTKSEHAPEAARYFQRELRSEVDWETHVTTLDEFGAAPFEVYVTEQKVGDLVLVPPRSVHQVMNHGGLAMKISWSRMRLENLKDALWSELPVYRRVCRLEQYRIKTVIYRSLLHYTGQLRNLTSKAKTDKKADKEERLVDYGSADDSDDSLTSPLDDNVDSRILYGRKLRALIRLFDGILREEFATRHKKLRHIVSPSSCVDDENAARASCNLACDFCGADIFQSFFECCDCRRPEEGSTYKVGDGLLVCAGCYVEGRSCACEVMDPVQCRSFNVLLSDRNQAAELIQDTIGRLNQNVEKAAKFKVNLGAKELGATKSACIFEAACALRDLRANTSISRRQCRGSSAQENHIVDNISSANCKVCHWSRCYEHLLVRSGSHSAEVILATREPDSQFHTLHKKNTQALGHGRDRRVSFRMTDGLNTKRRLIAAAMSFPNCKPAHAAMRLGWYDSEMQAAGEAESKTEVPAEEEEEARQEGMGEGESWRPRLRTRPPRLDMSKLPNLSADSEEESPLTPVDSTSNSPEKLPSPALEYPEGDVLPAAAPSATQLFDDEVISISSDGDDDKRKDKSVSAATHATSSRQNRLWVQMPPLQSRKRTESPASMKSHSGAQRRESLKRSATRDEVFSDDEAVGGNYAMALASALSRSNGGASRQPSIVGRRVGRNMSSEPVRSTSLRQGSGDMSSVPVPADSSTSQKIPQSRPVIKRPRPTMPAALSRSSAPLAGPSTSNDRPAKKRKRSGPPGVLPQDLAQHLEHINSTGADKSKNARTSLKSSDKMVLDDALEARVAPGPHPPEDPAIVVSPAVSLPDVSPEVPSPQPAPSIETIDKSHAPRVSSVPPPPLPQDDSDVRMEVDSAPHVTVHISQPPATGPSEIPPPTAPPVSTPDQSSDHTDAINGMAKFMEEQARLLRSFAATPSLTRAEFVEVIEKLKHDIDGLRTQQEQVAQRRDEALHERVASLEKELRDLQAVLKKERDERARYAAAIRSLEEKAARCATAHSELAIQNKVTDAISILMPNLKDALRQMVSDVLPGPYHLLKTTETEYVVAGQPPYSVENVNSMPQLPVAGPSREIAPRPYSNNGHMNNNRGHPDPNWQQGPANNTWDANNNSGYRRPPYEQNTGPNRYNSRRDFPPHEGHYNHGYDAHSQRGGHYVNYNNWNRDSNHMRSHGGDRYMGNRPRNERSRSPRARDHHEHDGPEGRSISRRSPDYGLGGSPPEQRGRDRSTSSHDDPPPLSPVKWGETRPADVHKDEASGRTSGGSGSDMSESRPGSHSPSHKQPSADPEKPATDKETRDRSRPPTPPWSATTSSQSRQERPSRFQNDECPPRPIRQ